jgi:hypothetical protein
MDDVVCDLRVGFLKESRNFYYKGLRISTIGIDKYFEITVDGEEYLDSTLPMQLPKGLQASGHLAPHDITNFRSVAGCIGYISSAFRPDLSLEISLFGRDFASPTLRDARKANETLAWAKSNRYNLRFRKSAT